MIQKKINLAKRIRKLIYKHLQSRKEHRPRSSLRFKILQSESMS